jgi:LAO/AO transport system kinase
MRNPYELSKLITAIEKGEEEAFQRLGDLLRLGGKAHTVGVTGSAGVGKSTLVSALIKHIRQSGQTVGVLLIDPSSALSGGAFLGDRALMKEHASDPGVFIRSFASRGAKGGLNQNVWAALEIMDAKGYDYVIVETLGAGQDEVDIFQLVHTVIAVLTPACGNDLQLLKAGLCEIGHLFVINKSDLPGADIMEANLQGVLSFKKEGDREKWEPKVIKTEAFKGKGVEEVYKGLVEHGEFLKNRGVFQQCVFQRRKKALQMLTEDIIHRVITDAFERKSEEIVEKMKNGFDFKKTLKEITKHICLEIKKMLDS